MWSKHTHRETLINVFRNKFETNKLQIKIMIYVTVLISKKPLQSTSPKIWAGKLISKSEGEIHLQLQCQRNQKENVIFILE